jgi:hypothetical protein
LFFILALAALIFFSSLFIFFVSHPHGFFLLEPRLLFKLSPSFLVFKFLHFLLCIFLLEPGRHAFLDRLPVLVSLSASHFQLLEHALFFFLLLESLLFPPLLFLLCLFLPVLALLLSVGIEAFDIPLALFLRLLLAKLSLLDLALFLLPALLKSAIDRFSPATLIFLLLPTFEFQELLGSFVIFCLDFVSVHSFVYSRICLRDHLSCARLRLLLNSKLVLWRKVVVLASCLRKVRLRDVALLRWVSLRWNC